MRTLAIGFLAALGAVACGDNNSSGDGDGDGNGAVDAARAEEKPNDDAAKAVLLLFYDVTRAPGSPEPRAVDVAAVRWATAAELDPALFPPADVDVLAKVARALRVVEATSPPPGSASR